MPRAQRLPTTAVTVNVLIIPAMVPSRPGIGSTAARLRMRLETALQPPARLG